MSEEKIYNDFIEWMKQTWIGVPEGRDVPALFRACYSPEEAEFLIGFPCRKTPLDELAPV